MSNFEKRFGKYAVSNLSLKLVVLYIVGYVLYFVQPAIFSLLTLDVSAILHGQIWRLVSWLLVPPDAGTNYFFVAIMLYFYYNIGTSLERVWGDYKYNVYVFLGIILTVASAFLWTGFLRISGLSGADLEYICRLGASYFSTYYINMCHKYVHFPGLCPDISRGAGIFVFHPAAQSQISGLDRCGLPYSQHDFREQRRAFRDRRSTAECRPAFYEIQKLDELFTRGDDTAPSIPQICPGRQENQSCGRTRRNAQMRHLRTHRKGRRYAGIPLLYQVRGRTRVLP